MPTNDRANQPAPNVILKNPALPFGQNIIQCKLLTEAKMAVTLAKLAPSDRFYTIVAQHCKVFS
jgi:hypothetical protein